MLEDYTTGPSIYETESSGTPAAPAGQAGEFEAALVFTPIPWYSRQDEDGDWQKVPALAPGFCYEDFPYGKPVVPYDQWGITGYNRWGQLVRRDVQRGYLTTFKSGVIVFDQDKPGFFDWLESIGIRMPPAPEVATGRPDGRHRVFDGRHLTRDQWPRNRNYAGLGDVKSNGFCVAPGALHPSGRRYQLTRAMSPPPYDPQWTRLLDEWWAANGHGTGGPHERGEGSGRNNELLRYKGMLYRQGIEQDDPEMARRVLAYNTTFVVPQSERYVRATVLRPKRWTRDSIKPAEHQDASAGQGTTRPGCHPSAAEGDVPGGPGAGQEAGGAAAPTSASAREEGVSAGQEIIGLLRGKGEPVRVQESVYQRELRPLKTEKQVLAKLRAEADPHPLSADWDLAPEGTRELYEDLADKAIEELRAGAPLAQVRTEGCPAFQLNGPWRDQIGWLLTGNGAALIEHRGGLITLLADPQADRQDPYPGAPADMIPGNPGRSWSSGELNYYVAMVRGCRGGEDLTQRDVCWILNHEWFRAITNLKDHKYVSTSTMSNCHVRLRRQGLLRIVAPAVHYRMNHRWRLESATCYKSGLRPFEDSELHELLSGLIKEVRLNGRDPDELRQRAEARKHPLTRAMEAAFA